MIEKTNNLRILTQETVVFISLTDLVRDISIDLNSCRAPWCSRSYPFLNQVEFSNVVKCW